MEKFQKAGARQIGAARTIGVLVSAMVFGPIFKRFPVIRANSALTLPPDYGLQGIAAGRDLAPSGVDVMRNLRGSGPRWASDYGVSVTTLPSPGISSGHFLTQCIDCPNYRSSGVVPLRCEARWQCRDHFSPFFSSIVESHPGLWRVVEIEWTPRLVG